MEEEKKQGVSNIEKLRQDLKSTKTDIEIINSARLATDDYDYNSIKKIKDGGQAVIFEVKSKIDGKTYIGKRLQYQIGSELNTRVF
jgi:septal ring factor EnvC (AmiA/AmiB activator)